MSGARRRPYHALRICVTCRGRGADGDLVEFEPRPGRTLFELVKDRAAPSAKAFVHGIHCLGNCLRPVSAVLAGRGKPLVMLSDLSADPATAEGLLSTFERYIRSETGRPLRRRLRRRAPPPG